MTIYRPAYVIVLLASAISLRCSTANDCAAPPVADVSEEAVGHGDLVDAQETDTSLPMDVGPEAEVGPDEVAEPDLPEVGPEVVEVPPCTAGDGCFMEPCTGNEDCHSGWCAEHLGTRVCTTKCDDDCPTGWVCKQAGGGVDDPITVCLSLAATLCKPCTEDVACQGLASLDSVCADYGMEGRFCGGACVQDLDCPWGFGCRQTTPVDGPAAKQCMADAGVCPCTNESAELGLSTICAIENENGVCEGTRICTDAGLSLCDAPVPTAETCNGQDDDCDGEVDGAGLCDDDNLCTTGTCGAEAGCSYLVLLGEECDDGDPCTENDVCGESAACAGVPADCNDDNPCTDDSCDEAGTCVHGNNTLPCDDLDPCTVADQCAEGLCVGYAVDCDCELDEDCLALEDGDVCNGTLVCDTEVFPHKCAVDQETVIECPQPEAGVDAACLAAACAPESGECSILATNDGEACDDENLCTDGDLCADGVCSPGLPTVCHDDNVCTEDSCVPESGCQFTNKMELCDDGNPCTIGEQCNSGECGGGATVDCNDDNPCTDDSCDALSGCVYASNLESCDDGNGCTQNDHCDDGHCVFDGILSCDDGNPCTQDSCTAVSGCLNENLAGACSDGDPCTVNDTCVEGSCQPGAPMDCGDGNPCTDDACDIDGICQHVANEQGCNDNDVCTQTDYCTGGKCEYASLLDCDDGNLCTDDSCDPAGGCVNLPNEVPCDDDNVCTTGDKCTAGACLSAGALNCDDGNLCTYDSCDEELGCLFENNALNCDDLDLCTMDDVCSDGVCVAKGEITCDDGNLCTDDACDPGSGECEFIPNAVPCDDGNACTLEDTCSEGQCTSMLYLDCDDGNDCTAEQCDPAQGCLGEDLADGAFCGVGKYCEQGICVGGQVGGFEAAIGGGAHHTCVLRGDGSVVCFGKNDVGQLGHGQASPTRTWPRDVSSVYSATEVVAGAGHGCATLASGKIMCWGDNGEGQVGDGTTLGAPAPVEVEGLSTVSTSAAGYEHTCVVTDAGAAFCWGANGAGQLGDDTLEPHLSPAPVKQLELATDIAAGEAHTCAVGQSGTFYCWGENGHGQLGSEAASPVQLPGQVAGIEEALTVAAGRNFSCVRKVDSTLLCFGANGVGQLGRGNTVDSHEPAEVAGLGPVAAMTAGESHACALLDDGTVHCWGSNEFGQLGSIGGNQSLPTPVFGLTDATAIGAGHHHSCALRAGGALVCWGRNSFGQLGTGTTEAQEEPAYVVGHTAWWHTPICTDDNWCTEDYQHAEEGCINEAVEDSAPCGLGGECAGGECGETPVPTPGIAVGHSHACFVRASGHISCWGANDQGQLGLGYESPIHTSPGEVADVGSAVGVSAWGHSSCAVIEDGSAHCWGDNSNGRLGNGTTADSSTPIQVLGLDEAKKVSMGAGFACALRTTGDAVCWGLNNNGQLGDGTTQTRTSPEEPVSGLADVSDIAAGGHACAVKEDGRVVCWGPNYEGQLGNGRTELSTVPVEVAPGHAGLFRARRVAVGELFSCALSTDGTVACWGDNDFGQLGAGDLESAIVPRQVQGLSGVVEIGAGPRTACAVQDNGAVWCWGYQADGEFSNSNVPVQIGNLAGAVSAAAGAASLCAETDDGAVYCRGSNNSGQLGLGMTYPRSDAQLVIGLAPFPNCSDCADDNPCTDNVCNADGSCDNPARPDSTPCGADLACDAGECVAGPVGRPTVAAGSAHTCYKRPDGRVACWGSNEFGELGRGMFSPLSAAPADVATITEAVALGARGGSTCAVLADGQLSCWGHNLTGQLGDGTKQNRSSPVTPGIEGVAKVSSSAHKCAVDDEGQVWCWGNNSQGQVGPGADADEELEPIAVPGIAPAYDVAVGEAHTCALVSGGRVWCWGDNEHGQLGNGLVQDSTQPALSAPGTALLFAAKRVVAGSFFTCALKVDGHVACWGRNDEGVVGNEVIGQTWRFPLLVDELDSVTELAAGYQHVCALREDGTVWCWGRNLEGQLGDGLEVSTHMPVKVFGLAGAVSIAAGMTHTCAVTSDDEAYCWGWNLHGQLGTGTVAAEVEPADVVGLDAFPECAACGDDNVCTDDVCNADGSCANPARADGLPCGPGQSCSGGECVAGPPPARELGLGEAHTCTLRTDGRVACFGRNGEGELGLGYASELLTVPRDVQGLDGAAEISANYRQSCALLGSGNVRCWGTNDSGQLGNGTTDSAVAPQATTNIDDGLRLSSGHEHTCVMRQTGHVICWGANGSGQVGDGTTTQRDEPAEEVDGLENVCDVAAGGAHACALTAGGRLFCWGGNDSGQLGMGLLGDRVEPQEVAPGAAGPWRATRIVTGMNHSCALVVGGTVRCWGSNEFGQLGDASNNDSTVPVQVASLNDAVALAAGADYNCALREGGTVYCWGLNENGQLGDGTTGNRTVPSKVFGLSTASSVATGTGHTCAEKNDGTLWCWGRNHYGQLGLGVMEAATWPVQVVGLADYPECVSCADQNHCTDDICNEDGSCANPARPDGTPCGPAQTCTAGTCGASNSAVSGISVGINHSCALRADGTMACWGSNSIGELGRDGTSAFEPGAGDVPGITTGLSLASDFRQTCVLLGDGTVRCWGYNAEGQLGIGNTFNSDSPVQVLNLDGVIKLESGLYHSCALKSNGTVVCWGKNDSGQLGEGTTQTRTQPVEPVVGLDDVFDIAAGENHTCALRAGGKVVCWGANASGQLGNGLNTPHLVPVDIAPGNALLSGARRIAVGNAFSCALKTDGTVACWGNGDFGQLGDDNGTTSPTPVLASDLAEVTEIVAGHHHVCAITSSKLLFCWGRNNFGQLGDNSSQTRYTPMQVSSISDVLDVAPGEAHTCARRTTGTAWCWGRNHMGQLGTMDQVTYKLPVNVLNFP